MAELRFPAIYRLVRRYARMIIDVFLSSSRPAAGKYFVLRDAFEPLSEFLRLSELCFTLGCGVIGMTK